MGKKKAPEVPSAKCICFVECVCFERLALFEGVVSKCQCGRQYSPERKEERRDDLDAEEMH